MTSTFWNGHSFSILTRPLRRSICDVLLRPFVRPAGRGNFSLRPNGSLVLSQSGASLPPSRVDVRCRTHHQKRRLARRDPLQHYAIGENDLSLRASSSFSSLAPRVVRPFIWFFRPQSPPALLLSFAFDKGERPRWMARQKRAHRPFPAPSKRERPPGRDDAPSKVKAGGPSIHSTRKVYQGALIGKALSKCPPSSECFVTVRSQMSPAAGLSRRCDYGYTSNYDQQRRLCALHHQRGDH